MACREILVTLKRGGHIKLPLSRHNGLNHKRNRFVSVVLVDQTPMEGSLADYGPITLTMVRYTPRESIYNSLFHQYHYLGYRRIVGQHLKYMAFLGNRPVACIGWGSAAWSVKSRDAFVGGTNQPGERTFPLW